MIDTDKPSFKRLLNAMMTIYYKPNLSNDALRMWWHKLEAFDLNEVTLALDIYSDIPKTSEYPNPPTPQDIVQICKNKRVTIHARLPSPLALADNKRHADEVVKFLAKNIKPKADYKSWARKIIANPENYPDISLKYAREALNNEGSPVAS